ncbi:peptidylprolyl isomerase [Thalassotalea nanhaiensis]|uniref:peptidylprolyl isomerase n=1 Tax=Thalassotalea nanhaiensis TaxID=3065648 RepID=A0ABY9TFS6_9GAMM|nr:peptidylprolyl isomerase [Colwelliaceae bacterium SQ345]
MHLKSITNLCKFTLISCLVLNLFACNDEEQASSNIKPAVTEKNSHQEISNQPWVEVKQQNLLYLQLDTGTVTILLADFFAPKHTKYIQELVNEGFYNGLPLYRVIENFVVQGGDMSEQKASRVKRSMQAEFEREILTETPFSLVQQGDLLAEQTGFINGFAVGRSISEGKEWLIHCPGAINLARGMQPNSGTTDFAIMFGTPPRHLDRNMSIFGRMIAGWEHFYQVKRGSKEKGGVISDTSKASYIVKAYLGSSLPADKQQTVYIENTATAEFQQRIEKRRKLDNDFYQYKGNGNMDVCYFPIKIKFE